MKTNINLYREVIEDYTLEIGEEKFICTYTKPGLMQYGGLYKILIESFCPPDLKGVASINETFDAATREFQRISSNLSLGQAYTMILTQVEQKNLIYAVLSECFSFPEPVWNLSDVVLIKLLDILYEDLTQSILAAAGDTNK